MLLFDKPYQSPTLLSFALLTALLSPISSKKTSCGTLLLAGCFVGRYNALLRGVIAGCYYV
jgi:hypothetical protein